jgi:hypothetical protein
VQVLLTHALRCILTDERHKGTILPNSKRMLDREHERRDQTKSGLLAVHATRRAVSTRWIGIQQPRPVFEVKALKCGGGCACATEKGLPTDI